MLHFILATLSSLLSGDGTGWTTAEERRELKEAMQAAGYTGFAESDPGAWDRHVAQLQERQPEEWRVRDE